jgi:hypothetical protein
MSLAALIPFTGFYRLNALTGSFVYIDTNLGWVAPGTTHVEASATISTDGTTSTAYEIQPEMFTGDVLTISGSTREVARLRFGRAHSDGAVSRVEGTLDGKPVRGTNPFNPIQPSVFFDTYYEKLADGSYAPKLVIGDTGAITYRETAGGPMQTVPAYTFNYAMFVYRFQLGATTYTFEMGTVRGNGKVAGSLGDGGLLVSIYHVTPPSP